MNPPDRIILSGLRFYGYHGVLPEEAARGQEFALDLSLETDLSAAGRSDDLADTVSYAEVFTLAQGIVEGERYNLLEALAQRLVAAILQAYPPISAVTVRLTKPNAPIPDLAGGRVGVEIRRER